MIIYIRYFLYLYVFIGFSSAFSGSYEDFFQAIRRDDAPAISSLLQQGFDPNVSDPQGQIGLFVALRESSLKVAKTFIDWPKTQVDLRNASDETPLMMAAIKGHLHLASLLIEKGADVNKPGWTALHYAATGGHVDLIRLLLEHHAYIDAESPNGSTPLMMAASYGSMASVRLLLEEGADAVLKNQLGLNAIDFAQRANRADVAETIASSVRAKLPKGHW